MLRRILPILLLLVLANTAINAQQIGPDSAYTDRVLLGNGQVPDLLSMSGAPDENYTTFDGTDEVYVYFRPGPNFTQTYPIKAGAKIVIYGRKDPTVNPDSSKLYVKFFNETLGIQSEPIIIGDEVNVITVPDMQFTYMILSPVHQEGSTILAFTRYYVDAILLNQTFDPLSVRKSSNGKITSAFPNPFNVERGTSVNFTTQKYADVSLIIMDIAGREVTRIDAGPRPAGEQSIEVTVPNEGVFMAQLMIDGVPAGKMIKLTSHY